MTNREWLAKYTWFKARILRLIALRQARGAPITDLSILEYRYLRRLEQ